MNIAHKAKQLFRLLYDQDFRFLFFCDYGLYNKWDDETYLKRKYKAKFHRELDLENPKSFNEKLQWLKLNDRCQKYPQMVDKYAAKEYVASIIGDEYIIPTLGVWDKFDDIDFDMLPKQFVLKCTHDSGGLVICKDKSTLNKRKAKKKIESSLKRNFYYVSREWPYSQVKPRIIAEKYMEDTSGELRDYKYYCFDGKMKMIMIAQDRFSESGTKVIYCDRNFNKIDIIWGHQSSEGDVPKPDKYEEMCTLAEKLSAGIPQVRVDFYLVEGQIYFGELTLFDGGGFDVISPYEMDLKFGEYITLPEKTDLDQNNI